MATSLGELSVSPAISVILPVLNEEPHLAESVSAILSQNYLGSFEIILALGPSRDQTNAIAERISCAR
jgi:succinoglycan biosynthesis protein ExoA